MFSIHLIEISIKKKKKYSQTLHPAPKDDTSNGTARQKQLSTRISAQMKNQHKLWVTHLKHKLKRKFLKILQEHGSNLWKVIISEAKDKIIRILSVNWRMSSRINSEGK